MTDTTAKRTLDTEDALVRGRELVTKIRALLEKSGKVEKWDESKVRRDKEGQFARTPGGALIAAGLAFEKKKKEKEEYEYELALGAALLKEHEKERAEQEARGLRRRQLEQAQEALEQQRRDARAANPEAFVFAPDPEYTLSVEDNINIRLTLDRKHHHPDETPEERAAWVEAQKVKATAGGRAMLARAVPVIRVPDAIVQKILEDGRFKSQHESGESGGVLSPSLRTAAEAAMFGTDREIVSGRPIYGMFVEDFARSESRSLGRAYGEVVMVLKDDVLDRTTTMFGDSLVDSHGDREVLPRPYKEFDWSGMGANPIYYQGHPDPMFPLNSVDDHASYVEAQFHGGVSLTDVKEVILPNGWFYHDWVEKGFVQRFKELGIPVRAIGMNSDQWGMGVSATPMTDRARPETTPPPRSEEDKYNDEWRRDDDRY